MLTTTIFSFLILIALYSRYMDSNTIKSASIIISMHIFLFWMIFIDIDMNSIDQFIHYIDSSNSNVLKEKIELLSTTITVMSFLFGISFIGISTDEKEINFSKKTKDFIFVLGFFLFINGFVSFFSFLLIEISL